MEWPAAVDAIGAQQHGAISIAQLLGAGMSRYNIDHLTATGRIIRIRSGVYRLCGVRPTWRMWAMAAVLGAGEGAVLSHRSAAVLWGLLDAHDEFGPLEVTTPRERRLKGVITHRSRLGPAEVTRRDCIPVTTAARTLLDLGESVRDAQELGRLIDDALRRGIVTIRQLRATVKAHAGPGRRYRASLKEALADRVPGYDPGANDWEQRMDRMWDELGLPPAQRQYRIRVGGRTYRPDRAIVDLKIAVDWNGYVAHGYRSQFDYDSDRRSALAAAGWYPLDFTSRSDPLVICRTVRAVVEERRSLLGRTTHTAS